MDIKMVFAKERKIFEEIENVYYFWGIDFIENDFKNVWE